ncbi:hypothetical protein ACWEV3_39825 [Saccharopolyspora sp. NPDC003752]
MPAVGQLPTGKAVTVRAAADTFRDLLGNPNTVRTYGIGVVDHHAAWPACRRAASHRSSYFRDQPDGGRPLPGAAEGLLDRRRLVELRL